MSAFLRLCVKRTVVHPVFTPSKEYTVYVCMHTCYQGRDFNQLRMPNAKCRKLGKYAEKYPESRINKLLIL